MDQFGQEIVRLKDEWVNIPRAILCKKVYKNVSSITVSKTGSYEYLIRPHVPEKIYTDDESLHTIKRCMWTNLFEFEERNPYNEDRHYPHIFSVYLKAKLDIDIIEAKRLDLFIEQIRNSVFVYVNYTCPPDLVAAANWLADGVLRMENFNRYTRTFREEKWLK